VSLSIFFPAARPSNERERQRAVDDCGVLRAPHDPSLHQLASEAAKLFDAPMAALSIVDRDRTWFAARIGLKLPETSRSASFCAHTILSQDEPLVILDAAADERFAGNPFVQDEPWLRFYAGAPVLSPAGQTLGALCALDVKPREGPLPLAALCRLADRASHAIAEMGRNVETLS
jgi:GAF domain-containing protein